MIPKTPLAVSIFNLEVKVSLEGACIVVHGVGDDKYVIIARVVIN